MMADVAWNSLVTYRIDISSNNILHMSGKLTSGKYKNKDGTKWVVEFTQVHIVYTYILVKVYT